MMKKDKKKQEIKPVKASELTDILTVKEMVDLEFSIPDAMIDSFETPEQYAQWTNALKKHAGKLFFKQGELISKFDGNIQTLIHYLTKHPELFADDYGEINRDMIKYFLVKHMDNCRAMIDKIQEIEKDLNLDIHQIW